MKKKPLTYKFGNTIEIEEFQKNNTIKVIPILEWDEKFREKASLAINYSSLISKIEI